MSLRDLNGWTASDRLEAIIDFQNVRCATNRRILGCAFPSLGSPVPIGGPQDEYEENRRPFDDAGEYKLHGANELDIRTLRLAASAIGQLASSYWVHGGTGTIDPQEFVGSIDKCAYLLQKVNVPFGSTLISPYRNDSRFPLDLQNVGLLAELAVRAKAFGIELVEPVSEPYEGIFSQYSYFSNPSEYINFHTAVYMSIKSASPSTRVALPLWYQRNPLGAGYPVTHPEWGTQLAESLVGKYNFVTLKLFGQEPLSALSEPWDPRVLTGTQVIRLLEQVDAVSAYAPVLVTAYGLSPLDTQTPQEGFEEDVRGSNILGTLFRANLCMLALEDSDILAMNGWRLIQQNYNSLKPGYLTLLYRQPGGKSFLYWFYYYMSRFVGDLVLSTIGRTVLFTDSSNTSPGMAEAAFRTCSLLPLLATKSDDDRYLYLVVANLDFANDYPVTIRLSNFNPITGLAYVLTSSAPNPIQQSTWDAYGVNPVQPFPIEVSSNTVSFTIPKHSVVFIRLAQESPWEEVIASGRRATLRPRQVPESATSAKLYISKYPEDIFSNPPVLTVYPPLFEAEWDFDTWGLNYYGFEFDTSPPVFDGPYPVWDEAVMWPIRAAEVVYSELVRHAEALSTIGAPYETDPVVVHFGMGRSLQPPYVAISLPTVTYEPLGFPLQKWGTAVVEVEVCTKLGGISQPYTYHNSLVAAVTDILNRLLKARIADTAFFADRIDIAGPVQDVEDSENMVLTSFIAMTAHVVYDAYNK